MLYIPSYWWHQIEILLTMSHDVVVPAAAANIPSDGTTVQPRSDKVALRRNIERRLVAR